MFWELWQSWRTPTYQPFVKKMGYLHEAIGMVARAKRCQAAWQAHYLHCQKVICQAIATSSTRRKVLIFGAGTLQDIPLAELSAAFESVILVDLVFLNAARVQAKPFPNVDLVEHDVTESLTQIHSGQCHTNQPSRWLDDPKIDLVISLNLITQLPLIPVRWLLNKQTISDAKANQLAQQLIQSHLDYLQAFDGVGCLIADRDNMETNQSTGQQEHMDPWWEVAFPEFEEHWDWQVVPIGERNRQVSQVNKVGVSWFNL